MTPLVPFCATCNNPLPCACPKVTPVSLPTQAVAEKAIRVNEWDVCPVCRLATLWCRGHAPAPAEPWSDLDKRVRDVKKA